MAALAAVATADEPQYQLAPDEMITVFLGKEQFAPPAYEHHPQVQYIGAANGTGLPHIREQIAAKSRLFVTTDPIPTAIYNALVIDAKNRGIKYISRSHPNGVATVLANYFPNGAGAKTVANLDAEGNPMPEKGRVQRFLSQNPPDPKLGITENGRILFKEAQRKGLNTTLGSLTQAVRIWLRKEQGLETKATSPKKKVADPVADMMQELEEMAIRLNLMKDYIGDITKENEMLKAQNFAIKKALNVI